MFKCKNCQWCYTEYSAGLVDACGNEELTEEEHDKYRNKGEGECHEFTERKEVE